jgi:transcriptional regulator with XRE-family HTH domain
MMNISFTIVRRATMQLGERLQQARKARRLSLDATAEPARISPAYLHKLEGGRVNTPSPRVLLRLADALDLPYWELMDLAGYVPAGTEPPKAGTPRPAPAGDYSTRRIVELLEEVLAEVRQRPAA